MSSIGNKIQNIRETKQISVEELAERSCLNVTLLEKIENNQYAPSLGPIIKIARSLGVRLGTFLDDEERLEPVLTRSGEAGRGVSFSNTDSSAHTHMAFHALAADKSGRHMEPFIVDIDPSENRNYTFSQHEGEEFLYVIKGEVELCYGNETYHLCEGDTIYYDSIVEHHVHCGNEESAKLLAVVYAPY